MVELIPYDEFGLFHENAEEYGLPFDQPPKVRREDVTVEPERVVSSLVWGEEPPELVLLHGGAQNAHTWDTVALALDRPLLAIDLPGHGHSDGGPAGSLSISQHAKDVAAVIATLAPDARLLVGMSLGGLTAITVADRYRGSIEGLALVDITPGVNQQKAAPIVAFVDGPRSFASFDELLERTIAFNPTRSVTSLRRGILHNAIQQPDGSWVWRHARFRDNEIRRPPEFEDQWEAISRLGLPLLLLRGTDSGSVVDDADEEELMRRAPQALVARVKGAGHSIQGDKPLELAELLGSFLDELE